MRGMVSGLSTERHEKTNGEFGHGSEHLLLIHARELVHPTLDQEALESLDALLSERNEMILYNTSESASPSPPL